MHRINVIIFIVYGIAVTLLSLKPDIDTGELPYNDKLAHFLTYALFTLLAWRITHWKRTLVPVVVGIITYSGLIEVAQHFTGRTMSLYDLVANTLGVACCMLLLYLWEKYHAH